MSAQPSHVTTLETIEHLDFEPETPCEHSWHAGRPAHRADLLVRSTYCCEGGGRILGICLEMWRFAEFGLRCARCGTPHPREFFWEIVEVLS